MGIFNFGGGSDDGQKPTVPAKAQAQVTREQVIDAFRKYLDARNLSYTYNDLLKIISMDFSLRNKLESVSVEILFDNDRPICVVRAHLSQEIPAWNKESVLNLLMKINSGLVNGAFSMDEGKIQFQNVADYDGLSEIKDEFIARSVMTSLDVLKVHGSSIHSEITRKPKAEASSEQSGGGSPVSGGAPRASIAAVHASSAPAAAPSAGTGAAESTGSTTSTSSAASRVDGGDVRADKGEYVTPRSAMSAVRKWLDKEGYKYDVDDDRLKIIAGFSVDSRARSATLSYGFYRNGYMVRMQVNDASVPEENREKMAAELNKWNYSIDIGNYEMNVEDGRIFYRNYVVYEGDDHLASPVIGLTSNIAISAWNDPPEAVMDLLFGPLPKGEGKVIELRPRGKDGK